MAKTLGTKIFTVDKFLGLNEAADGSTELKLGEASKMENFYITDEYNLKTRPGTAQIVSLDARFDTDHIAAMWAGSIGNQNCLVLAYWSGVATLVVEAYQKHRGDYVLACGMPLTEYPGISTVKAFCMNDSLYVVADHNGDLDGTRVYVNADGNLDEEYIGSGLYHPLVLTGGSPAGGGTALEPMNLLADLCYLEYSADGTSTAYVLPSDISEVRQVTVDQVEADGTYDPAAHTFTFRLAPQKGVNNVRFFAVMESEDKGVAVKKFLAMRHAEAYNGATDSRLFFYGDGTNVCYYTGAPAYGSGLYIPAGNEIAVDASASAITGMVRHSSRLMAFKPDGAYTINYEPVTLADGSIIAGFYVRPASRDIGNEMDGQIQTVENYPRTLCGGNLYEWRHSASYYPDERYAKMISQKVSKTLAAADPGKIITCDDNVSGTYYMFLNDDAGTVLVNRYRLDAWSVYTGDVFKNIRFAEAFDGEVTFANATAVYALDPGNTFDANGVAIPAVWESGYMAFGADYRRKYSSRIWLSMLPETNSNMDVTVSTDRREDYLVKTAGHPLVDFLQLDFSAFSFLIRTAPRIQRVQIKVKKFVYYKLIFRVTHPGARATVLGYDQQIRYSSTAK